MTFHYHCRRRAVAAVASVTAPYRAENRKSVCVCVSVCECKMSKSWKKSSTPARDGTGRDHHAPTRETPKPQTPNPNPARGRRTTQIATGSGSSSGVHACVPRRPAADATRPSTPAPLHGNPTYITLHGYHATWCRAPCNARYVARLSRLAGGLVGGYASGS